MLLTQEVQNDAQVMTTRGIIIDQQNLGFSPHGLASDSTTVREKADTGSLPPG
jgi:hypothetical protein